MPAGYSYYDIPMTHTSQQAARIDVTGLMVGKFIEMANGNTEPIFESINALMAGEPERMGGCLLTLLNLLVAFISDNGNNMDQFQKFNDFLIKSLTEEDGPVRRIV